MNNNDIMRIQDRFIKDYRLNIDKGIAFTDDIFKERLEQLEYYKNGINEKYKIIHNEICSNFENMDKYYDYRNELTSKIISDLCDKQDFYNFSGNEGAKIIKERFPLKNLNISSNFLNDNNINKDFFSIDLKSANFNVLRLFNKELVNNKNNYEDFMGDYTNLIHFKESKYLRQRIFGKARVTNQISIEKSVITSILYKLIEYISINDIVSLSNDEIVFYKNEDLKTIFKIIKDSPVDLHFEEFQLTKIDGLNNAFIKKGMDLIENKPIFRIYGVSPILFPFVLEKIYNLPHKSSYDYFVNQEGYLSKFIKRPF